MNPISFLDLKTTQKEICSELEQSFGGAFNSGWHVSEYTTYCDTVSDFLYRLFPTLLPMYLTVNNKMIAPSNTYIAIWPAFSQYDAIPAPVELGSQTYQLDPTRIEVAIIDRTKVIFLVHLYHQPAEIDPTLSMSKKHNSRVLKDGVQTHCSRYKDKRIGTFGDIVTWCFCPGKNLEAYGDGGAITTNDPELADRTNKLRNYESRVKYINGVLGFNSRLDTLQAAALRIKLKVLDKWNARRSNIDECYSDELKNTDLLLPLVPEWAKPVWYFYVVQHPQRDNLQKQLGEADMGTLIHYPISPPLQAAYVDLRFGKGDLPIAERIYQNVLSLPIGPHRTSNHLKSAIKTTKVALRA